MNKSSRQLVLLKLFTIFVFANYLTACGWLFGDKGTFRDRSSDYRKARTEKALQLPSDIKAESIRDSYAIPAITDNTSLSADFEVPGPEPLSEDLGRESVRINKLADERWILVNGSPGQVWPKLRNFLSLNKLSVLRVDAAAGLIETDWIQPSLEGAVRERYRLRVEQGVQRETTEVYVLQADINSGSETWPSSSSNDEREELMTSELAQFLADSSVAAVSMLAQQTIDSSGKVTIEEFPSKIPYIKLKLPFSRAWASLRRALDKAGYQIDDLDRSQRLFYVNYSEEQASGEEPGFFASLFSGKLFSSKDSTENDKVAYKVKMNEPDKSSVEITIERQGDNKITKSEAEALLKLIKRHIS